MNNMCLYEKIMNSVAKEVKTALLENEDTLDLSVSDKENKIFDLADEIAEKTGETEISLYVAQDYINAQVYIYGNRGEPVGQRYIDIEDVYVDTDMRDITVFTDERDEYTADSIEEASTPEEYNEFLDIVIKHLENYEVLDEYED
jgi:hypothetical protein